tara:strand:- start:1107 stop:1571 length:465 start_codon:yes stop_codon:yes gene_type:complete
MIFEAIAVVQTANTAIGAVKELLKNGRDITDCADQLGKYFNAKAEIQKKSGGSQSTGSDLENFLHLEKLRQQEEELKNMLIYQGRANLYTDFLKFQAEAKRNRDEALEAQKKAKIAKQKRNADIAKSVVIVFSCLLGLAAVCGFVYWLSTLRAV